MRLRVAPLPASSRSVRVAFPGCPFRAPSLLSRRPNPRVAPWFQSFGCAGVRCSSCPELLMPSAVLVSARFRVAPWPASSCSAPDVGLQVSSSSCISGFTGDGSSSRPDARIFRRCRAASPRVAPSISLSVSPTIVVKVAPHFESSGTD